MFNNLAERFKARTTQRVERPATENNTEVPTNTATGVPRAEFLSKLLGTAGAVVAVGTFGGVALAGPDNKKPKKITGREMRGTDHFAATRAEAFERKNLEAAIDRMIDGGQFPNDTSLRAAFLKAAEKERDVPVNEQTIMPFKNDDHVLGMTLRYNTPNKHNHGKPNHAVGYYADVTFKLTNETLHAETFTVEAVKNGVTFIYTFGRFEGCNNLALISQTEKKPLTPPVSPTPKATVAPASPTPAPTETPKLCPPDKLPDLEVVEHPQLFDTQEFDHWGNYKNKVTLKGISVSREWYVANGGKLDAVRLYAESHGLIKNDCCLPILVRIVTIDKLNCEESVEVYCVRGEGERTIVSAVEIEIAETNHEYVQLNGEDTWVVTSGTNYRKGKLHKSQTHLRDRHHQPLDYRDLGGFPSPNPSPSPSKTPTGTVRN